MNQALEARLLNRWRQWRNGQSYNEDMMLPHPPAHRFWRTLNPFFRFKRVCWFCGLYAGGRWLR